jgi:hypothetical protein
MYIGMEWHFVDCRGGVFFLLDIPIDIAFLIQKIGYDSLSTS